MIPAPSSAGSLGAGAERYAGFDLNEERESIMAEPALATSADPWEMALEQFHRAARYVSLKRGIREFLAYPKRELTVNFPVKMDDGSVRIFTGYRVHHSTVLGPTKGTSVTTRR